MAKTICPVMGKKVDPKKAKQTGLFNRPGGVVTSAGSPLPGLGDYCSTRRHSHRYLVVCALVEKVVKKVIG